MAAERKANADATAAIVDRLDDIDGKLDRIVGAGPRLHDPAA